MSALAKLRTVIGKAIGSVTNPEDRIDLVKMSIQDYLAIQSNTRQRDTVANALKATRQKRFDIQYPSHTVVFVAEDKTGERMLIDGHTRQYLMANGKIHKPEYMNVVITYVDKLEDSAVLYTHYDSALAAETSTQQAVGAMRELGMKPKYSFIQAGGFLSALALVGAKGDVYARVGQYRKELMACDSLKVSKTLAITGILSAMILTIKNREVLALAFWKAYMSNQVEVSGGKHDAVGVLMEEVAIRKREKRTAGGENIAQLARTALWCYQEWVAGTLHPIAVHKPGSVTFPDFLRE